MLILTRRYGQSIIIGDDIRICLLGQFHGQTKIGIKAPDDVSVHREEIWQMIKEENRGNQYGL